MAWARSAIVTVELREPMYITKIKVYPIVEHYTKFKVIKHRISIYVHVLISF